MPRVSQDHLDARRQQILDAARVCFARNGFHATSMPDLFAATGLSSGAVYRYFSGKEEIVMALASNAMKPVLDALHQAATAEPPLRIAEIIDLMQDKLLTIPGDDDRASLAIQILAESVRNPAVRDRQHADALGLHQALIELIERVHIPTEAGRSAAAWSLMALGMGTFLCQNLMQDTVTPTDTLVSELGRLLNSDWKIGQTCGEGPGASRPGLGEQPR